MAEQCVTKNHLSNVRHSHSQVTQKKTNNKTNEQQRMNKSLYQFYFSLLRLSVLSKTLLQLND